MPDNISGYSWTPVLFARISKAGKCIGRKFAGRYYDAVGYGALLYVEDMLDGTPESIACASCADHTSILPFPMYDRITLESGENVFAMVKDGITIYSTSEGSADMIEDAISKASATISLRTGDIIAIELAPAGRLASRGQEGTETNDTEINGSFCGNELFRFKIRM